MNTPTTLPAEPPYEDGVFECTINDLIKNHNLVLCNQRGDALFYFDQHEGKPIFLASPIESKNRWSLKNWHKTIPWKEYSYETGDEKDFLIPRNRVRKACRLLGLKLTHIKRVMSQNEKDHLAKIRLKGLAKIHGLAQPQESQI